MSMKSFDKFCEKLITAEPGSEKEIFDERQNVMRMRLAIEALFICVCLILINGIVTEMVVKYQWAEYMMTADLLFAVLSMLWWIIRCAVKGCLVAVSGRIAQKTAAVMSVLVGALNGLRYALDIGEESFLIKDGRLSADFVFLICFALMIVCGIFMFTAIRREEKREETERKEENDES